MSSLVPTHWPVAPLLAFLFVVAFCRAGATYALARGARRLSMRWTPLTARSFARAEAAVRAYGPVAVVLCFFTVGIQTAVHSAAGSLRMPLRRYLPALALGALAWALLYGTVGLSAAAALWSGGAPRALVIVALVILLLVLVLRGRRRSGSSPLTPGTLGPAAHGPSGSTVVPDATPRGDRDAGTRAHVDQCSDGVTVPAAQGSAAAARPSRHHLDARGLAAGADRGRGQ